PSRADEEIDLRAPDVHDQAEVLAVAAGQRAHEGHGFARQRRAADGHRRPVLDLRDDLFAGDDLVHARPSPPRRNASKGAVTSPSPPSTTIVCPITYRAAGVQRNATTAATSSGLPIRPRGVQAETIRSNVRWR